MYKCILWLFEFVFY